MPNILTADTTRDSRACEKDPENSEWRSFRSGAGPEIGRKEACKTSHRHRVTNYYYIPSSRVSKLPSRQTFYLLYLSTGICIQKLLAACSHICHLIVRATGACLGRRRVGVRKSTNFRRSRPAATIPSAHARRTSRGVERADAKQLCLHAHKHEEKMYGRTDKKMFEGFYFGKSRSLV